MGKIYYCKENGGFYLSDVHDELPQSESLVEITEDRHKALIDAQSSGKMIVPGDDGMPVLVEHNPPTLAKREENARKKRNSLLAKVGDRLQRHALQREYGPKATISDDLARALASYAQALRDVPQQPGFPDSIQWPDEPIDQDAHHDH